MQNHSGWIRLLSIVIVVLLVVTPVLAQDDAPEGESDDNTPTGLGTLMLVIGMGAVVIVGGTMIARERFNRNQDER